MKVDSSYFPLQYQKDWPEYRLKWTIQGSWNGVWGDEPDGENDLFCIRVADFNRNELRTRNDKLTLRAIQQKDRRNRLLKRGDLLLEKSGGGEQTLVGCVVEYSSNEDAVCSNFVARMSPATNCHNRFLVYLHSALYDSRATLPAIKQTTGIQNLDEQQYLDVRVRIPVKSEQASIAAFLDCETAKIDRLIEEKERLLLLLDERRQALITQAVTRGLDPSVPMKDSGVSWLKMVPMHWKIQRGKWLFRERDLRSSTGEEELLTVSHLTGVTPRSEKNVSMFLSETNEGCKICRPNDLVINTMWAWMGAMGISWHDGICSPSYNVYEPNLSEVDPEYLDFLVRIRPFIEEVTRHSKGIWSSRLRLYPEGFFSVMFALPPVEEQKKIVDGIKSEISSMLSTITTTRHSLLKIKEYRTALIHEAVTLGVTF